MISPVRFSLNPFFRIGPIISKADMYCELTFPARLISSPVNIVPVIRKGGKPSFPAYSICAPNSRKASTRIRMGRCCIRSVPVMMRVPGVTLR